MVEGGEWGIKGRGREGGIRDGEAYQEFPSVLLPLDSARR